VKAEAVVCRPLVQHLGVDDNPAVLVGLPFETDTQLPAHRARTTLRCNDIRGAKAFHRVGPQVRDEQFHAVGVLVDPHAFVPQQNVHSLVPVDAVAKHLLQRRLIDEQLWRVRVAARLRRETEERPPGLVDEVDRFVREHVLLEPLGQADALPNPDYLFIGRDGARTRVDRFVAFDDYDAQSGLAEDVCRGCTGRPVADDGNVVGLDFGHVEPLSLVPVVIATV
jgi:hypothetical protein